MRLLPILMLLVAGCGSSAQTVRFATFNSSLSRQSQGELLAAMKTPDDAKAKAVAAVVQAARPDVLLLQEFDHDATGETLRLFQENYLKVAQQPNLEPIAYRHAYLAPSNTGVPTGVDLNGDGLVAPCPGAEVGTPAYAADCHGYGLFPGQYAFVILSKHPIDRAGIRTFQEFLWKDLPGNHIPPDYYSDEPLAVLRLSSKNHVDVPITIGDTTIHVLASHPTPPVFDGPEDRNGRRNFDEVSFVARVVFDNIVPAAALLHEALRLQPLDPRLLKLELGDVERQPDFSLPPFVSYIVMGDLNADPSDGDSYRPPSPFGDAAADTESGSAINFLIDLVIDQSSDTTSPGGVAAAERDGGVNADHAGDPAADTADWDDSPGGGGGGPGNLRVDYVLPSRNLDVLGGGVFWPTPDRPLMGVDLAVVEAASDHRLVWVDVRVE